MEVSSLKNNRVLIVTAVALLLPFCLVPSVKAQSASGSMMHKSDMMNHNKSMGQNKTTMSDPSAPTGGGMGNMNHGAAEHMKSGHMMDNHTTEPGHGNMSDNGSNGQMTH